MVYDPFRVKERENKEGGPVIRGKVLKQLIDENNLQFGAELGVRSGELYYYLIANCPDLHLLGVDLYEIQPEGVGEGHRWKTLAEPFGGFSHDFNSYYTFIQELLEEFPARATFIKDWTNKACDQIEDGSLDFVFIDADHSYKSVCQDIELWSPKVREGGFITGHDYWIGCVKRAVHDTLGNSITLKPDHVWIYKK